MPTLTEYNADIPFRLLPAIFWKPASQEAIKACQLDVFERWENLCIAWLSVEMETGVFRRPDA